MAVMVSLTGRVSIEAGAVVVDELRFPGRQGRLVFAYLVIAQGRLVPKGELAAALWGDQLPAKWDKALSVLVSKLRAILSECGLDGPSVLTSAAGCYRLALPPGSWVDVGAAGEAAAAAEKAISSGDLETAVEEASVAATLARRSFLPGEYGNWVEAEQRELHEVLVRALDALAEATRGGGDAAASSRAAEELVALEPFRERGYRLLMEAQSAAGNEAEALLTYERCRTLLAEELGAYPSRETEAVYLEILRRQDGVGEEPEERDDSVSSPAQPPARSRRRRRAALAAVVALLVLGAGAELAWSHEDAGAVEVLPDSLVRIDPETLEPKQVVPVGRGADLVVAAGGYIWTTHWILRDCQHCTDEIRNAGDRTLTRVDPSTGESQVVGGGLAPCGMAPDPSGDLWVVNCFASGSTGTVVRIDAKTLRFEATWPVPNLQGYFRGLAYGGGWLWVADTSGTVDYHGVLRVDPHSGATVPITLPTHAGNLAWADGYGDLWANDFARAALVRLHPATGVLRTVTGVGTNPADLAIADGVLWVGDWGYPQLLRLNAATPVRPRPVILPVPNVQYMLRTSSVWTIGDGAGAIWAATPRDHALWRIDPETNETTRIPLSYFPTGVAVADDGVWVAVRGTMGG